MRKQTHFKKVVSFALAAAMAVSVCTAALADDTQNETTEETAVSEQAETDEVSALTTEAAQPVVLAADPQSTDVAQIGDTKYATLKAAVDAAKDGDTITLLTDTTEDTVSEINASVTIDGQGHTVSSSATRIVRIEDSNLNVTLKNITFVGDNKNTERGIQIDKELEGVSLTVENCKVSGCTEIALLVNIDIQCKLTVKDTELESNYYSICLDQRSKVEADLSNVTTYGYAALDIWSMDSKITATNCNFNSVNVNSPASDGGNDYATIVFDGDGEQDQAKNTTLTLNNCTISASQTKGALQSAFLFNGYTMADEGCAKNNKVIMNNTSISIGEGCNLLVQYTKENTLIADQATLSSFKLDTDTYHTEKNDDGTYTILEGRTVEVDVAPAEPGDTVVAPDAADKVDVSEAEGVKADDVVSAAESVTVVSGKEEAPTTAIANEVADKATVDGAALNSEEAVQTAKKAIAEKAESDSSFDQTAADKDVTILAVPKLSVVPVSAANNAESQSMTFDIKMVYDVKATVADLEKGEKMTDANTVTLKENQKMDEVKSAVAISLDVSALKIPAGQKVFVRHVKENGAVNYYEGKTTEANGIVTTVEFVNPDGFSEFTVMANKSVTVKIDGQDVTFTTEDIGKAFTAVPQEGYNWLGVSINGTVYTTFTKELYDAAYKGEALVGVNAYEEIAKPAPTATPAPVEEAAPVATAAPTATPDDSQYYTCTACGHHDWTATADGYKCNYCGHLETKQISGYKNVKGVYTPSTTSAKSTAAKAGTIPQTSDEMPIVPIAIVAIAALLGLGVTAYMKKKQN